jgi:hypothetical protein
VVQQGMRIGRADAEGKPEQQSRSEDESWFRS